MNAHYKKKFIVISFKINDAINPKKCAAYYSFLKMIHQLTNTFFYFKSNKLLFSNM